MSSNTARKNLIYILILLIPYLLVYILSQTFLASVYLPKWTAEHFYFFSWIFVIILVCMNKKHLAIGISAGNSLGILLGQIIGDVILAKNADKITIVMDAGKKDQLNTHYGMPIWVMTIIIASLIAIACQRLKTKKQSSY